MQKTPNNRFGSKIRNMARISVLAPSCFHCKKGRVTFFRPEKIVASFLHLMVLFFKVISIHTFLHFCNDHEK